MFHWKNLTSDKLTTLLGVLIVLASIASVFMKTLGVDWGQASIGISAGIGLMFYKRVDANGNATVVILLCALLVSCIRPAATVHTETTKETYRDTTIYIAPTSVSTTINQDSVMTVLQDMVSKGLKPQIIYKSVKDSPTNLVLKLSPSGKLIADCSTNEQVIKLLLKEVERLKQDVHYVSIKEIPHWFKTLFFVVLGFLIISLIINFIKW